MNDQEFSVREVLNRSIDGWWIMVLLAVAGAIAGWAFHYLSPRVYQATATMTVSMDFAPHPDLSSDDLTLTTYEEDYAFNSAEFIIDSAGVKSQVIAEAKARGLSVTPDQLNRELTLERRQSDWEFYARDHDPHTAAELVNLWAEKSYAALNATLKHAIKMDSLNTQIGDLTKILAATPPGATHDQYQATLDKYTSEVVQEKAASSGLLPSMSFTLQDEATSQGSPVLYSPGLMVLGGAAIGFILSLWLTNRPKARPRV